VSQQVGTRSPRGQVGSPKVLARSPRAPTGKLQSPTVKKVTLENSQSPAVDKSQHHPESSFHKDLGTDVELERFNTTESDEDIAKVCGQMEDEVKLL